MKRLQNFAHNDKLEQFSANFRLNYQLQCSLLSSGSVNSEILIIQTDDYGPCSAYWILTLHLRQIHN